MVIDHIMEGQPIERIWECISKLRRILGVDFVGSSGVFMKNHAKKPKGVISLPEFKVATWDRANLKKLAAIAPGCTLNIIHGKEVKEKYRLHIPPRIYNISKISCKNNSCVAFPANLQREVEQHFDARKKSTSPEASKDGTLLMDRYGYICRYCEHVHSFDQIWVADTF